MSSLLHRTEDRVRRSAYAVWLTACGVYFLAVLHRSSLGVAGPQAQERLGISAAQLGAFVMLQLGIYAVMQVPAGLLIDRFGPRKVLLAATLVVGGAQMAFAFAATYPLALAARATLGMGDAAVYLSVLRLAAQWFPRSRYAVITMWSGLFGMAGNFAATVPLTLALGQFGWTPTFAVTGATSVVYALLLLRPAVAAPYKEAAPSSASASSEGHDGATPLPRRGLRWVLAEISAAWRGGELGKGTQLGFWTHQATMTSGAVLSMVWGYPYLTQALGYRPAQAAWELSVLVLATLAFSFVIGPAAGRRPGIRMPLAIGVSAAMLLAWALLLGWPGGVPPRGVVTIAFVVLAAGGPASQIGFHLARDYNPQARISTATGLVNAGGFVGAMVGSIVVGVVLDALAGADPPTLIDFRWALASLAALSAVSMVAMIAVLLRQRSHILRRISSGEDVVVPVVAHWWDAVHRRWRPS